MATDPQPQVISDDSVTYLNEAPAVEWPSESVSGVAYNVNQDTVTDSVTDSSPEILMTPFIPDASESLGSVADQADAVRNEAATGGVHLDLDAADALIATIGDLRARAVQLVADCTALDQPLRFGNNWVGETIANRLRSVAIGDDKAVTPVLSEFENVLSTLETAVRAAAGRYVVADDETKQDLDRATKLFGLHAKPEGGR